jgi:hypothetical protein
MAKYEIKDGVGIIPEGTTVIEPNAFFACTELKSIIIPDSVTIIGEKAFSGCSGLTSIVIGNSVKKFGNHAFENCSSLTSIVIPASVTEPCGGEYYSGGYYTDFDSLFKGCTSLNSIRVAEGNPLYDSRDNCNAIIDTKRNILVLGCKTTTIPKSVTKIYHWAYSDDITSVVIPEWIEEIDPMAFWGCKNLASIKVAGGNSALDSRNDCNAIIETASNKLICGCVSTVIPNKVKSIGNSAFHGCETLKSIVIPDSVKEVGERAFRCCFGLTNVVIGKGVKKIGEEAFDCCENIETVTFKGKVKGIDRKFFSSYKQVKALYTPAATMDYYKEISWPLGNRVVELQE